MRVQRMNDRIVLVTGGAGGSGIARRMAAEAATVLVADIAGAEALAAWRAGKINAL